MNGLVVSVTSRDGTRATVETTGRKTASVPLMKLYRIVKLPPHTLTTELVHLHGVAVEENLAGQRMVVALQDIPKDSILCVEHVGCFNGDFRAMYALAEDRTLYENMSPRSSSEPQLWSIDKKLASNQCFVGARTKDLRVIGLYSSFFNHSYSNNASRLCVCIGDMDVVYCVTVAVQDIRAGAEVSIFYGGKFVSDDFAVIPDEARDRQKFADHMKCEKSFCASEELRTLVCKHLAGSTTFPIVSYMHCTANSLVFKPGTPGCDCDIDAVQAVNRCDKMLDAKRMFLTGLISLSSGNAC